ncbi:MAG: endonuclease [Hyphomicrobiales bacterium]
MRKTFLLFIALLGCAILSAQIPEGYYNQAEGLKGQELKEALHNIIKNHKTYSYDDLRDFILRESDEDPENSNNVIVIYSGRSYPKNDFGGGANDWNREHVWAKSHGDFGTKRPAGSDAHHIRPCDASVNSSRGNKDFDIGGTPHKEAAGCFADKDSWEPRDEVKGDVARMLFYMATRYEGEGQEPDLELNEKVNNGKTPFHGKLSALLEWHKQDPPDAFEKRRNEVVFSYQENRNPFIDHPEYVIGVYEPDQYTSVDDIIKEQPLIFYKRGQNILNVDLSMFDSAQSVNSALYDITGTLVKEISCKAGQQNNISLVNNSNGVYIIKLKVGEQVFSHKIIL